MDYRALKNEIAADPAQRGYAGKTDAQIADLLNAPGTERLPRGLVSPSVLLGDLFDVVIGLRQLPDGTAVPAGLPATLTVPVLKQLLADIRFVDPIDPNLDSAQQFMNVLAAYGLLGEPTVAATRIQDVSTVTVSRAEKLLGRGLAVTADDVHNAKVGDW